MYSVVVCAPLATLLLLDKGSNFGIGVNQRIAGLWEHRLHTCSFRAHCRKVHGLQGVVWQCAALPNGRLLGQIKSAVVLIPSMAERAPGNHSIC
jgi:hypothetical protein